MPAELSPDDRGKTVVSHNNRIGAVTDVRSGTAFVDPDLDHVPEQMREDIGWTTSTHWTKIVSPPSSTDRSECVTT